MRQNARRGHTSDVVLGAQDREPTSRLLVGERAVAGCAGGSWISQFTFLQEAHRLVAGDPTILDAIDADLDLHGQRKKALRVADAQWNEAQSQRLPTIDIVPLTDVAAESLLLGVGSAFSARV